MSAFLRPNTITLYLGVCYDTMTDRQYDKPKTFLSWCARILRALDGHVEVKATFVVSLLYHRWAGLDRKPKPAICGRDLPLTVDDCGILDVNISARSTKESTEKAIDTAYMAKKKMLEAHSMHKLCPIRAEQDRLLRGLETARGTIRDGLSRFNW